MDPALMLSFALLPAALVVFLRRTRLWWVPGIGMLLTAVVLFATMGASESASCGGMAGLGDVLVLLAGLGLAIYGFAALMFAARSHDRACRPRAPQLPMARVAHSRR